jgi:hypothetical protein
MPCSWHLSIAFATGCAYNPSTALRLARRQRLCESRRPAEAG